MAPAQLPATAGHHSSCATGRNVYSIIAERDVEIPLHEISKPRVSLPSRLTSFNALTNTDSHPEASVTKSRVPLPLIEYRFPWSVTAAVARLFDNASIPCIMWGDPVIT